MQSKSWNYNCDKRLSFIGAIEGKSIITLGPAYALMAESFHRSQYFQAVEIL